MSEPDWARTVREARGEPIGGGAAGSVRRVRLPGGGTVVVKHAPRGMDVEAAMLRALRERSSLPVPGVLHAEPGMLVMEDVPGRAGAGGADAHAAEMLASLHAVSSPDGRYGFDRDGLIGPLAQPNAWADDWAEFFRDRRLLAFTHAAAGEGAVPRPLAERLERLAGRLGEIIPACPGASLIHGDVWSGNVLTLNGRVTGFIDPAPYYAHAEVELSFIALFSTFGDAFFARYWALRGVGEPERAAWRRVRGGVYNLYPLLVHARLFGGHYVAEIDAALRGLGF